MKITKFIHSCVLVEDNGKTVLFDPGNYTRESNLLDLSKIDRLDAIAITHEHMDHMDIPLIKQIVTKFPNTPIFGNTSIKGILEKEGISVNTEGNDFIKMMPVPHEKIFMGPSPLNDMITFNGKFATPGDSLTFNSCPDVLALPVQAPWGSTTWACETALKVKPKYIVPIHDFHWKDTVKTAMYNRLEQYFAQYGITFLKPQDGISLEI